MEIKTGWSPMEFFRISSFVCRSNKIIQIWKDLRVNLMMVEFTFLG